MDDKELLELAAKAAGIEVFWGHPSSNEYRHDRLYLKQTGGMYTALEWNPLIDDGDALRLAVKMGFMDSGVGFALVLSELQQMIYPANVDPERPYAATRRAIVRAASQIGKEMKP